MGFTTSSFLNSFAWTEGSGGHAEVSQQEYQIAINRFVPDLPMGVEAKPSYIQCQYCGRKYKDPQESCRGCGADVF